MDPENQKETHSLGEFLRLSFIIGMTHLFAVLMLLIALELWGLRARLYDGCSAPKFSEGLLLGLAYILFTLRERCKVAKVLPNMPLIGIFVAGASYTVTPLLTGFAMAVLVKGAHAARLPTFGFFAGVALTSFIDPFVLYAIRRSRF